MANRYYTDKTKKLLYGFSGGACAKCKRQILIPETDEGDSDEQIAEICHIIAFSGKGPRGDPDFPEEKINDYCNLLLMCPTCHDEVDKQTKKYTPEYLRKLKQDHLDWFLKKFNHAAIEFGIPELDLVVDIIASSEFYNSEQNYVFDHVNVADKINKNEFGKETQSMLHMGLVRTYEVKEYFSKISIIHTDFIPKLKGLFKDKYNELKKDGKDNDDIFLELLEIFDNKYSDLLQKAAATTVLAYMFEICEVFEK